MRLTWARRLLPLVFGLALAASIHGQSFGFAWWRDAQFQRELGLSTEQSARIDAIFQAAISQLRPKKEVPMRRWSPGRSTGSRPFGLT